MGVRQTDDMYVVAQADGSPLKPNSLTHEFVRFIAGTECRGFASTTYGIATRRICWRAASIPKSLRSVLATLRSRLTLDLYSHVLPGMQADAASRVDEALRQALDKHRGRKRVAIR